MNDATVEQDRDEYPAPVENGKDGQDGEDGEEVALVDARRQDEEAERKEGGHDEDRAPIVAPGDAHQADQEAG